MERWRTLQRKLPKGQEPRAMAAVWKGRQSNSSRSAALRASSRVSVPWGGFPPTHTTTVEQIILFFTLSMCRPLGLFLLLYFFFLRLSNCTKCLPQTIYQSPRLLRPARMEMTRQWPARPVTRMRPSSMGTKTFITSVPSAPFPWPTPLLLLPKAPTTLLHHQYFPTVLLFCSVLQRHKAVLILLTTNDL